MTALGSDQPRYPSRRPENSRRMLAHGAAAARQVLEAAGTIEVMDSARIGNFAHYMGTARMGNDPRTSVVNAWNQAQPWPKRRRG